MYEQLSLMTFQPPTSGASAFRAKTSASQANKKGCKRASEADCFTRLCDCLPDAGKKIDPNGFSSKMLKIYLALETDLISRGCCVKWGGHGYTLQWDTLNSKNFGVPQNRERVFIVGYLGNIRGREVFPLRPADGENPCELNEITQGVADAQRIYDGNGLARTLKGESGGQGGKTGLYAVRFRYTERGEKSREKGRMEPIEIANALTSKHCGDQTADCSSGVICMSIRGQKLQKQIDVSQTLLGDNIRIRRLTPRECWRLQGFPDEYFDKAKAAGISDTQLYKQAGNGVTVNVARAIGERLKEVEENGKCKANR